LVQAQVGPLEKERVARNSSLFFVENLLIGKSSGRLLNNRYLEKREFCFLYQKVYIPSWL
jgi:hypothetical protein